jgi:disulfide bond formation protein DsbB
MRKALIMTLTHPTGLTQKLAAFLLLLGALALLSGALGFQHIGGYVPCKLCLAQRQPHYAMLPFSLILLLATWRQWSALLIRATFILLAGVILYGAGIGVYQAGAEWDFWLGPNDCGGGIAITESATNLLAQINKTKIVSCNTASWRMLGLSFAGWNVVASSILAAIALIGAFASQNYADRFVALIKKK